MAKIACATEHDEQVALIEWWAYACTGYGVDERLLFAVPNGGARHPAVAGKLKAEGVRAGVPDLVLAVPRAPYHGLYLEMKAEDGRPSAAQKEVLALLAARGYFAAVARGFDVARGTIDLYLRGVR